MSVSSEEFFQFKDNILSKRKQMLGLNSGSHWLRLHPEVQVAFAAAFGKLSPAQLSSISGFPMDAFEKWQQEWEAVEALKKQIQICLKLPGGRISPHLKPELCAMAKLGGILKTAHFLGVSRSSLARWIKEGWDNVSSDDLDLFDSALTEDKKNNAELSDSSEAAQLATYLERHKGKRHKKYSLAEKKLMLGLVERFGSKAVHDHYGVSYDTIARLKRREESEIERKKRIPMRYIPVIDIMRKHPGMGPMQIRD